MGDNIPHDPHRRLRRIDIRIADHELLEDVVLDRPFELALCHPLLLRRHDEHRQHRDHRPVHGHRHAHPVERNPIEQDFHVLDTIDRHPGLADIADHARMIAVISPMRRQIERDRQPLLPLLQRLPIKRIALPRGGETGILPDSPWPVGIHGGAHAPGERLGPGHFRALAEIHRLHRDAAIVAVERGEWNVAEFLLR